jgi:hypothetical protein
MEFLTHPQLFYITLVTGNITGNELTTAFAHPDGTTQPSPPNLHHPNGTICLALPVWHSLPYLQRHRCRTQRCHTPAPRT